MVYELLDYGLENARTGKELAALLNTDKRTITQWIETERRRGLPICADMHEGYFIAETPEELEAYCNRLQHRADELIKTREVLTQLLIHIADQKTGI